MRRFICLLLFVLMSASVADAQVKGRKGVRSPSRKTVTGTPSLGKAFRVVEEASKTFGLSVDKYVSTYDVNADGTSVHIWEMERRCSSAACLEIIKKLNYVFNADLQKVEVIEAGTIKPDGKRTPLSAASIKLNPTPHAEAATGFSSLHELNIEYDGLKIDEPAYAKIRIETMRPNFDNQFGAIDLFPLTFDWKSIEINLSAPKSYRLFTESPGLDGGQLADENGRSRWRWHKKDLAALDVEPAMYDIAASSPRFAATSFKDYDQLGRAFWQHVKAKAVVTPEVQELADRITKDIADPKQQASAIYEWVNKNIRYLLVVIDRGGVIPHSTTEILANRYGDCKDYTTIIYALLKAKGIDSMPVLIRSDLGSWFPTVAVPHYFNHAVLYIPSLKMIADATAPNTRLGLIPQTLVGKKAVLSGEQTGVLEIPKDNPDDNEISTDVEIEMQPDGSVRAVSRNTYKGRLEMIFRPMFGSSAVTSNSEMFVKSVLSYYGVTGTGRIKEVTNPFRVGDPFSVEIESEIPNYTTFLPSGRYALPLGVNLNNSLEMEQLVSAESRRTNLVSGAMRMREKFIVKFPATVTIGMLPPSTEFKNAAGHYRNEIRLVDGTVHLTREIVLLKDIVTPAEYPQIRELIKKAVESHKIDIPYTADPSLLKAATKETNKTAKRPARRSAYGEWTGPAPLSNAEVMRLENKLKNAPDDLETRRSLLLHYFRNRPKQTPKIEAGRLTHRLWFVKNHPAMSRVAIYGYGLYIDSFPPDRIAPVRAEWLKQIEGRKEDFAVRRNAIEFFRTSDDDVTARRLLTEGVTLFPDRYEFAVGLTGLLYESYQKLPADTPAAKKTELLKAIEENGDIALRRLKTERSTERDASRNELLVNLAQASYELGSYDRSKSLATELVLEFGQSENDSKFDDSSHVGNVVLGRIALRRGDTAKAKQHLIAAVRAPLRQEYASLSRINLDLARELFEKGEKEAVAEYFKLCEGLSNLKTYPESYFAELKSLKVWQEQIKQGKKPSFKFGEDEPLP